MSHRDEPYKASVGAQISAISVAADGQRVAVVGRSLFKLARIKRSRAFGVYFTDWIDARRPHTAAGGFGGSSSGAGSAQSLLAHGHTVGGSATVRTSSSRSGEPALSVRRRGPLPSRLALGEVSSNDCAYNPSIVHLAELATAATSKSVNVWSDARGVPQLIASLAHARTPAKVAWHPSSPRMILVASPERSVRYWDVRTAVCAAAFRAGAGSRDLAWAPSTVAPHRFAVALESGGTYFHFSLIL